MKGLSFFRHNSKGQALIEYLILVALMAVASIGVIRSINHVVNSHFVEIDYALRGQKKVMKKDQVDQNLKNKRDLSNFMNGVGKNAKQ